jgi:zinc protease
VNAAILRSPRTATLRPTASVVVLIALLAAAGDTRVITPVSAQTPAPPERPAVGPERPFQLAPRVERTLPNGLRVIVTRQMVVPKVTVMLTVLSGYAEDPRELTGLAALTADGVQEGTKTRNSREIRRLAFSIGGSLSAGVSQDFTSLSLRGLAEFTPQMIDLVSDVAINPVFPADEVAILKQQRLQGVAQQKSSPQAVANRQFRRQLFGDHPYARTSETEASVQAIDRSKIEAFHRDHYRPDNAFLLVVGAVEPDAVISSAEKSFGPWKRFASTSASNPSTESVRSVLVPGPPPDPTPPDRHLFFVQRPNSVQSSIALGNLAVKRSDARWYELTLANTVFGGAFNSRIIRNIREDKGYTYSPSSTLNGFADAGFYRLAADVRNEVTGATLVEVFKEIDKMRAEGSDGSELQGGKQYMRGLFSIQTATQSGLANTLNSVYVFGLAKDYPETFRSKIAAVTPTQVKTAASTLLDPAHTVVVVVGDYAKVKEQLAQFGAITFLDLDGNKISAPQ